MQFTPQVLATGGAEKKLRIFDLTRGGSSNSSSPTSPDGSSTANGTSSAPSATSYEIGPGVHQGTIKSIVWNPDYNILTTASDDRKIRWWDLRSRHPVQEYEVDGPIGSCELNTLATENSGPGVLSVAAGKTAYFFDGMRSGQLLKRVKTSHEIASVAVNADSRKFVTGGGEDTWARVWDLDSEKELGKRQYSFLEYVSSIRASQCEC